MSSGHSPRPSKKHSGSSADGSEESATPRETVFFVDRSLGRALVQELRELGHRVVAHDELFDATTEDVVWLEHVGNEGWIALSKDGRIRYNPLEIQQLEAARVYFFLVPSAQMRGEDQRRLVTGNLDRIIRLTKKVPPPLIARLGPKGVTVLRDREWISSAEAIRTQMTAKNDGTEEE